MAQSTKTEGAIKAGDGRFIFDLAKLTRSTPAPGIPRRTGPSSRRAHPGRPHAYGQGTGSGRTVIQRAVDLRHAGHARRRGGRREVRVSRARLVYIPSNVVTRPWRRRTKTPFFTCKDTSHGIVARGGHVISRRLRARFGPRSRRWKILDLKGSKEFSPSITSTRRSPRRRIRRSARRLGAGQTCHPFAPDADEIYHVLEGEASSTTERKRFDWAPAPRCLSREVHGDERHAHGAVPRSGRPRSAPRWWRLGPRGDSMRPLTANVLVETGQRGSNHAS